MQLEPGPFPVVPDIEESAAAEDPGFTGLVADELGELPGIEESLDGLVDPFAAFKHHLEDEGTGELHDYAGAVIEQIQNYKLEEQAAEAEPFKRFSEEGIIAAYQVIPGEAFTPVPPEQAGPDGAPVQVVSNPLHIILTNLTRPGDTNFAVGDEYQVDARIELQAGGGGIYAGVDVLLFPWCEDYAQSSILIGTTNQFGNLSAKGSFLPDQWGRWGGTFYSRTQAGALMAGETFYWTVSLLPGEPVPPFDENMPTVRTPLNIGTVNAGPQVPSGITVELVNTTRPGDPNFRSSDHWILTVSGAPDSPVKIWGTYNGDPLAEVELGQTDAGGLFILEGDMYPEAVGQWVERYSVGGTEWERSLEFAVTE